MRLSLAADLPYPRALRPLSFPLHPAGASFRVRSPPKRLRNLLFFLSTSLSSLLPRGSNIPRARAPSFLLLPFHRPARSLALSSRPRSRFLPRPANHCFSFFPLTALFAGHRAVPRLFSPSAGTPPSNLHADLFVRIAASRTSSPSRPRDPDRCHRSVLTEIQSRSLCVSTGRFRSIRATSFSSRLAIPGSSDFAKSRSF